MKTLKFYEAIHDATEQCMEEDPQVFVIGLGVTDPKGIFGTTLGLEKKFGQNRAFDMPLSENAMTGIVTGAAIAGMKPILVHQRLDFAILSLDQLINNSAKWHFMFNGQNSVPMVVRLIIGRGWGQGPQHSQSLHSYFAHIPGLKVLAPAFPQDAKNMLVAAVKDPNPVVLLEHRWLYNTFGSVTETTDLSDDVFKAKKIVEGSDVTIVASSHMTLEALRAAKRLMKKGISAEVIDLRSMNPIDYETIELSVKKTGKLLVLDGDWKTNGLAGEIIAHISEYCFRDLQVPPSRITYPDHYVPTSWKMAQDYYPSIHTICKAVCKLLGIDFERELFHEDSDPELKDVPDPAFMGPF